MYYVVHYGPCHVDTKKDGDERQQLKLRAQRYYSVTNLQHETHLHLVD
jgi:hypothetical protein